MLKELIGRKYNQILTINRRNQKYIRPFNPESAKRIADNKLLTKRVLAKHGIQTPESFKIIRTKKQLQFLDWETLPKSFVIKPNSGTVGSGIIIFYGKVKRELAWIRPSGKTMNKYDQILHMENILEGRYSMGGRRDVVIIEERINNHPELKKYSYKGVPDIRIIVLNGIPIMAMLRLPTKASDGKANLHAGGIGVGIDIASGVTTSAVISNPSLLIDYDFEIIEQTQDLAENHQLSGIKIPFWEDILKMTLKAQQVTGIGYLGADIVIDKDKGPMILELNARPGLGIQLANMTGLRHRLERVVGLEVRDIDHGIRVAKSLFGGQVEEEIEHISGKQVVNLVEKLSVYYKDPGKTRKKKVVSKQIKREIVNGMLDTGIVSSRIDRGLAARVGYADAIDSFFRKDIPKSFESFEKAQQFINENQARFTEHPDLVRLAKITENGSVKVRPVIRVYIKIAGTRKDIDMIVSSQSDMLYPILIGRSELKKYLIDTSKTFTK